MSRAPRLFKELCETLLILASALSHNRTSFYTNCSPNLLDNLEDDGGSESSPCIPSTATYDSEREAVRKKQLKRQAGRDLAMQITSRIKNRLGYL